MNNDFQDELARLFDEDDERFSRDEADFVGDVNRRINQHMLLRRVVLSGAVLVGGAFAGLQAPELLSDFSTYLGFDGFAAGAAVREFSDMSINMLVGVAIAALSLFATFSSERI